MSEGSDKNGYLFPYTAEEDHLATLSRNQGVNDINNPGLHGLSSRMSSRQGSRTSSPPSVSGLHPLAPLTSITDTSE